MKKRLLAALMVCVLAPFLWRIFSSEVWASSCWRMSSWMFWELSKAYSISRLQF